MRKKKLQSLPSVEGRYFFVTTDRELGLYQFFLGSEERHSVVHVPGMTQLRCRGCSSPKCMSLYCAEEANSLVSAHDELTKATYAKDPSKVTGMVIGFKCRKKNTFDLLWFPKGYTNVLARDFDGRCAKPRCKSEMMFIYGLLAGFSLEIPSETLREKVGSKYLSTSGCKSEQSSILLMCSNPGCRELIRLGESPNAFSQPVRLRTTSSIQDTAWIVDGKEIWASDIVKSGAIPELRLLLQYFFDQPTVCKPEDEMTKEDFMRIKNEQSERDKKRSPQRTT